MIRTSLGPGFAWKWKENGEEEIKWIRNLGFSIGLARLMFFVLSYDYCPLFAQSDNENKNPATHGITQSKERETGVLLARRPHLITSVQKSWLITLNQPRNIVPSWLRRQRPLLLRMSYLHQMPKKRLMQNRKIPCRDVDTCNCSKTHFLLLFYDSKKILWPASSYTAALHAMALNNPREIQQCFKVRRKRIGINLASWEIEPLWAIFMKDVSLMRFL